MFISLIVTLIVVGLVWWLVKFLPLPPVIASIVNVLFILLAIIIVLSAFGVIPNFGVPLIKI